MAGKRKSSCLLNSKSSAKKIKGGQSGSKTTQNSRDSKLVVIDGLKYPGESVIKSRKLFSKYVNTVMNDSGTNSPRIWMHQQLVSQKITPRNAQIDAIYAKRRNKVGRNRHHFTVNAAQ